MIRLRNIEKSFSHGPAKTFVLRRIDLEIQDGEFVSIMGPSGAGKSTLLHILGMHDQSWSGEYYFDDVAVHKLDTKKRAALRNRNIGFVFQSYHLLDDQTVFENLELPLSYRDVGKKDQAVDRLRHTRQISDRRQKGSLSQPTIGRTAATGRGRACGSRQSANDSRGRTHGQSALQPGQRNHGDV